MDKIADLISINVKQLRKEKKITRKELGELIGYSEQAIYYYERGERSIPAAVLGYIAQKTNRNIAWFYQKNDKKLVQTKNINNTNHTHIIGPGDISTDKKIDSKPTNLENKIDSVIELLQLQMKDMAEIKENMHH